MEQKQASDLHLRAGCPPYFRVLGNMEASMVDDALDADQVLSIIKLLLFLRAGEMVTPELFKAFEGAMAEFNSVNISSSTGLLRRLMTENDMPIPEARLRVNIFFDREGYAVVARRLPDVIRTLPELGFEPGLGHRMVELSNKRQGLVLVTGPTGSGKTSTLAAIINEINRTRNAHIITIEDPIELIYPRDKNTRSLVTQREVGLSTPSFRDGLEDALREDPNIIMVGELRNVETMATALTAAETGHLVFATLHTNSAWQTVNRIVNDFPPDRHAFIRQQVATVLRFVLSQYLLPPAPAEEASAGEGKNASGQLSRVLAYEYMENSQSVASAIRDGDQQKLPEAMRSNAFDGTASHSVSLESCLSDLVRKGRITEKTKSEVSIENVPQK